MLEMKKSLLSPSKKWFSKRNQWQSCLFELFTVSSGFITARPLHSLLIIHGTIDSRPAKVQIKAQRRFMFGILLSCDITHAWCALPGVSNKSGNGFGLVWIERNLSWIGIVFLRSWHLYAFGNRTLFVKCHDSGQSNSNIILPGFETRSWESRNGYSEIEFQILPFWVLCDTGKMEQHIGWYNDYTSSSMICY